jgi:hypothetical protein
MDIEQLSKSQIVLLTLLVSFVTSIATGIVTVSLVDQAPPAVAETVNRVIERTVEKTLPSQAAATVVTQQKTVVVRESDLVAQAVTTASPSVVRVYSVDTSGGNSPATFLGLGLVLSSSGDIATDESALGDSAEASVALPDGTTVRAFVTARDESAGVAYLTATSTSQSVVWVPAKFSSGSPVLGESAVTLAGETVARIGNGLISSVTKGDATTPTIIDTNIPNSAIMNGSPLIATDGTILGVSTGVSRTSSPTGFIAVSALSATPSKQVQVAPPGSPGT